MFTSRRGRKTQKLIFSYKHLQTTAVLTTVSTLTENRNDHNNARKTHPTHNLFILVIQEITGGAPPHKELGWLLRRVTNSEGPYCRSVM